MRNWPHNSLNSCEYTSSPEQSKKEAGQMPCNDGVRDMSHQCAVGVGDRNLVEVVS